MSQFGKFDLEGAFDRYGDGVYRFCLRLLQNPQDAEDLAQEAFLEAAKSWKQFDGRCSEATWIFRIARNRAWKLIRRRKLERLFRPEDSRQSEFAEAIWMAQCVSQLPLPIREAFLLIKVEGFSCAEASQILGVPEGTVKFRIHQAVHRLQKAIAGQDELAKEKAPHAV